MNILLDYFWPLFAAGLIIGGLVGSIGFRRQGKGSAALTLGVAITLAATSLWHGPMGAAQRLAAQVERNADATLAYYEMTQVTAHLQRQPLTRVLVLSGAADDFQRKELVRTLGSLPAVSAVRWSNRGGHFPLVLQGLAAALAGFLFGLGLAYLIELRRRYNAQWSW